MDDALRKEAVHKVALQIVVRDTAQADHVLHTEIQITAAHAATSHDQASADLVAISHVLAQTAEAVESVASRKCQSTFPN